MKNAVLGCDEWQAALDRYVDWANFLIANTLVTEREAFEKLAELFSDEHFGVESISIENFSDIDDTLEPPSMRYLNMGDTYATTLILTDDYLNGVKLMVSCWGDWYESNEQHHCGESGMIRCGYCGRFTDCEEEWSDTVCQHCNNKVGG